ncbi:MAG TPA: phospholipase D-like domain-containing protein [Solirubrobacterales bacterium]|nr:phospholipase D-like domain-containing protein [Solirubrobacterales bacterium]
MKRPVLRGEPRPPLRRDPRFWVGPAAALVAGLGWYASESLRHRREGAFGYEVIEGIEADSDDFMRAAEALTGHPIAAGCEVELLVNGDRIFPALLETIAGAERTLCLETYIYWKGDVAGEVAAAVCERARAGVECKVLVDALGGAQMESSLLDDMQRAGATVCRFRPPRPYALHRLTNRSHRRLLIADGRTGMTGGVGIAGEWEGDAKGPDEWRDSHLKVSGPVLRDMQGAFAEHWLEATGEVLAGEDYLPALEPDPDGDPAQLIRSNAGVGDTNTEAIYYLAIASARRSLDLTSAYFVPRPAFTEALCEAAGRGVEVRIVVPGPHIDKGFVRTAGRAAYAELIEAGVRIYEFMPTMLHAKSLAVDERWAMVGTMNFDNRSFQLHDEVTLGVWSERFNSRLRQSFEADLERCEAIGPDRWSRRPLRMRVAEGATKFIRREL